MMRQRSSRTESGFTLVEVLISLSVFSLGLVLLGSLLIRGARQATAASSAVYQTAALSAQVGRLGAMPFTTLAAGNACDTTSARPLPRITCTTITDVNTKRKRIKVVVTPTGNPMLSADSTMFERSPVTDPSPPLNMP